eukprot:s1579_g1.t1
MVIELVKENELVSLSSMMHSHDPQVMMHDASSGTYVPPSAAFSRPRVALDVDEVLCRTAEAFCTWHSGQPATDLTEPMWKPGWRYRWPSSLKALLDTKFSVPDPSAEANSTVFEHRQDESHGGRRARNPVKNDAFVTSQERSTAKYTQISG